MAVAVKSGSDTQTRTGTASLAVASVLGAIYILGSIAVVAWGVPWLWRTGVEQFLPAGLSFVSAAGLILVLLVSVGVLAAVGAALVGPSPRPGLKAGIFTVLVWVFLTALVAAGVGRVLERWLAGAPAAGMALTGAVGLGLLLWGWTLLTKPKTAARLRAFEEQGWFSARRYKPSQGLRVRRATMLGIMLLGAAGIYSLYNHGTLTNAGVKDWVLRVPFSSVVIPILPDVRFTVPLLLAAATFWLAFRIVSLPVFADFLIATEAELNKVSWPARRSVIQDTVVVLVTVLLLTVFLFAVDLAWGWILSRPVVGVLQVTPQQQAQQRQQEQQRLKDQVEW